MEFPCEKCGRIFNTRMGKGVHQSRCTVVVNASCNTTSLKEIYNDDEPYEIRDDGLFFDDIDCDDYDKLFCEAPFIPDNILKYVHLQEEFYKASYSIDALRYSSCMDDFLFRLPIYNEKESVYNKLLKFTNKTKLSLNNSRELMDLIKAFKPQIPVPSDIRVTKRHLLKKCKFMLSNILSEVVEWPVEWNMSSYSQVGGVPDKVKILAIDPYEALAYKLCDPVLQFVFKDHIKYNYYSTNLEDGTKCWSHFMTSDYAKRTEEDVKLLNPDAILIPLIAYSDGVALGLRSKV